MKKQVIILIALLLSSQFLFSQMDASKKMEQFIEKKATDWQESYEKKDVVAYAKLLKEFAGIYESLDSISKQDYLGTNSSAHYTMACLYAIANNKKEALDFLHKTIAAGSGYFDYKTLDTDPDIDNIRNEPEFQKILAKMKQCGDYLSILKNANKYNFSDNRSIPKFSYQGNDNPNLVALREGFNLDSVAGQGSDVLKNGFGLILLLMPM